MSSCLIPSLSAFAVRAAFGHRCCCLTLAYLAPSDVAVGWVGLEWWLFLSAMWAHVHASRCKEWTAAGFKTCTHAPMRGGEEGGRRVCRFARRERAEAGKPGRTGRRRGGFVEYTGSRLNRANRIISSIHLRQDSLTFLRAPVTDERDESAPAMM